MQKHSRKEWMRFLVLLISCLNPNQNKGRGSKMTTLEISWFLFGFTCAGLPSLIMIARLLPKKREDRKV